MIDSGEVAADIGLEYVAHLPSHDLPPKGLQGVVRVATRSKAETAVEEVGFEHSLEYACDRPLQQPGAARGNSHRARAALSWSFGYFNPSDRWRPVHACLQLSADFLNPLLHLAGKLFGALPSTPLAAFRFIIRQVSLRNAGVSRCANEVNRACRSNFAFFAI